MLDKLSIGLKLDILKVIGITNAKKKYSRFGELEDSFDRSETMVVALGEVLGGINMFEEKRFRKSLNGKFGG